MEKTTLIKKEKRIRYNPTWVYTSDNGAVLAYSEAMLKTSGIVVSIDGLSFSRQWEIIGLMEVGESVLARKVENNYSAQALTHSLGKLTRTQ